MNKDFRLNVHFFEHPKTIKLERALGLKGIWSLLYLWTFAAANRPEGVFHDMDEDDIEIAARWQGQPGLFLETVTSPKCQWIDFVDGDYQLHNWNLHQGYVVNANSRSEAAKANANKRWENRYPKTKKTRHQQLTEAMRKKTHTEQEWNNLKVYFSNKCVRCGKPESIKDVLVKDHIVTFSKGGSDGIENIQPLCKSCSRGKSPECIDFRLSIDPELKCLGTSFSPQDPDPLTDYTEIRSL